MLVSGTISFFLPSRVVPVLPLGLPGRTPDTHHLLEQPQKIIQALITIYKFETLHTAHCDSGSSSLRIINNSIWFAGYLLPTASHPQSQTSYSLPHRFTPFYCATSYTELITYSCKLSAKAHTKE